MIILIKQVHDISLTDLAPLIEESEAEGFHFLTKLREQWLSGQNRFDREGEALFVAELDGQVVGVCGLNRDPYDTASHSGRVRRLYVAKRHRRTGVGRSLISRVIEAATGHFSALTVRADNPIADSFYQAMGFERVAEKHSTHRMKLKEVSTISNCMAIR
jgi:ribosomal protein S18 acetylase RimI-like enzyme